MARTRPVTTEAELLKAGKLGRCELISGELRRMNPASGEHGRITNRLAYALTKHALEQGLGTIYAAETGFLLSRDPDTIRAPDIAFLRAERAAQAPKRGFIPGAPDLAVEVLSPDDRPGYIRDKVRDWLAAGAQGVWLVDPIRRTVQVHEVAGPARTLGEDEELEGGDAMPGFRIAVTEVFL